MVSIIELSSTDDEAKCACGCPGVNLDDKELNKTQQDVPTKKRSVTSNFTIHRKVLGKGAFGTVRCCTSKRTKQMLAIKTIRLKGTRQAKSWQLKAYMREAFIHAICSDNPNVVQFIEKFEGPSNMHMIMELCNWGDLHTFSKSYSCGSGIPAPLAAIVMRQVAGALHHVHGLGIVHRDIKAHNIFVSSFDGLITESSFKIGDFGLATRFQYPCTKTFVHCTGRVGTPGYQAPELLRGEAYYSPVDIWSFGIMLAIMLTGEFPISLQLVENKTQDQGTDWKIDEVLDFRSEPWSKFGPCLQNMLTDMLQFDPEKRPTAHQLLDYCWIRNSGRCKHPW